MRRSVLKPGDDIFFTRTMAELLERQGHMEDAIIIYRILADSNPDDRELTERMRRLEEKGRKKRG